MKTFLLVAAFCLLPFPPVSAEDISIDGQTYRLETIHPVRLDSFGRLVPMPPMTVLVPVLTMQSQLHPPQPHPTQKAASKKTRTFLPQVAKSRSFKLTAPTRIARIDSSTPDVAHPVFNQRSPFAHAPFSDKDKQQLTSTQTGRISPMVLDSRSLNRKVF
ncbi:MAG: hypothetical protein ABJZ55_24340 [Fuerstiella sp.]